MGWNRLNSSSSLCLVNHLHIACKGPNHLGVFKFMGHIHLWCNSTDFREIYSREESDFSGPMTMYTSWRSAPVNVFPNMKSHVPDPRGTPQEGEKYIGNSMKFISFQSSDVWRFIEPYPLQELRLQLYRSQDCCGWRMALSGCPSILPRQVGATPLLSSIPNNIFDP